MVHDSGQPRDILGAGDAFVLGLVREHRPRHDVADRPDAVDRIAEIMVSLDLAALIGRATRLVQRKAVGIRPPPYRLLHDIVPAPFSLRTIRAFSLYHRPPPPPLRLIP